MFAVRLIASTDRLSRPAACWLSLPVTGRVAVGVAAAETRTSGAASICNRGAEYSTAPQSPMNANAINRNPRNAAAPTPAPISTALPALTPPFASWRTIEAIAWSGTRARRLRDAGGALQNNEVRFDAEQSRGVAAAAAFHDLARGRRRAAPGGSGQGRISGLCLRGDCRGPACSGTDSLALAQPGSTRTMDTTKAIARFMIGLR